MAASVDFDLGERLKLDDSFTGQTSTQADREKAVSILQEHDKEAQMSFDPLKVRDINASRKPLSHLKKTALDSLVVNDRSTNSYLMLRCLSVHLVSLCKVVLILEDHQGGTCVCIIYNHVFVSKMEEEFYSGIILVIKEPFLKQCKDDNQALVIWNPTDLVKITRNHNLAQEAVLLGWIDTSKDPVTVQEWGNVGNNAYRLERYVVAIEAFLMGLKLEPNFESRWKFHLNLVLTYYKAGFFELCLEHALLVLQMKPENQKSLYHAGLSHYELRQYSSAKQYFEKLLRINPSHRNAILEMARCEERTTEHSGKVDVYKLLDLNWTNLSDPIDFGDFVGPIEVASMGDRGRGMVAKEDLRPGTLVLAEKAVVADMVENSSEIFGQSHTDYASVLRKTLSVIFKNQGTFGKLLELCCSKAAQDDKEGGLFCSGKDNSELCLDVPRILNIIETNSFGCRSRNAGVKHSLLYYYASFVNHSCIPNCSMYTYNDVMLIRTATLVKKGEEITIAYKIDYGPRLEELSVRGFICNCAYCDLERRDSRELKMERITVSAKAPLIPRSFRGNVVLECMVSVLEESYGGREKYTTVLFHPYLDLADSQDILSSDFGSRFMHFANKALNCLGLSTQDLLRCTTDKNAHLPREALLADEDLLYEAALKIMVVQRQPKQRKRWHNVLLMLERTFAGGNLRTLRRKFPQAEFALH